MRVIELQALLHHHVQVDAYPHQSPAYNSAIATLINKGFIERGPEGITTSKAGAAFVEQLKAVGEPQTPAQAALFPAPEITKAQLRKADQDARSMTVGEAVIGLFRIMGGTLLVIFVIVAFISFLQWLHP
ncbi:hypothetical protein [Aureimonas sp. AU40]|uniref:hypothetical protein n=1 Tax=Aureimonas sp. AU40 TaxID=1637747 RepID=UPI0007856F03|nr:hypothetical protein [Aureimonas sp. AU40]